MQIGDIVTPVSGDPLHCGSGFYPDAVVIQLEPLVLVSRSSDMRWQSTIQNRPFKVLGQASKSQLEKCRRRLDK